MPERRGPRRASGCIVPARAQVPTFPHQLAGCEKTLTELNPTETASPSRTSGCIATNWLDSGPQNRHKDSRFPMTPPARKGAVSLWRTHLGRREHLPALACSIAPLLAPTLIGPAVSSAQAQTGAITGKITDESGVGVPYANVFIKGTQLGGMANAEGKFTIVKVPVGNYTLSVRSVGHAAIEKTVQVNANQTATVDFQITEQAVKMKQVDIKGDVKIAIRKKDSSTKQIVTSEDLRSLPVDNYKEAIGLKAGVISQGGELHFRGGRGDEVLTIVNGIASRNPMRAEGVDLGLLAVSSSEQVLGGLDAQYGNALSGVINLTTREGGDKFGGEVRYFTDRYGEADKSFNNFERLSTGFGGPFLFPKTNYFISFEGTYTDTYLRNVATHQEHRFLDFIRLGNRQSNSAKLSSKLTFKLTPNEKLNVEIIKNRALDGEYQNRWNRQGWVQVRQDSTAPTDGTVTTRYGAWSYFQVDSSYIPMNTAEHLPVTDEDYLQTAVTWKHTLGVGTIYNLRASRQEWQTTTDVLDRMPWEYQQLPNNYYDPQNRLEGPYYVTNGDYPFFERKRTVTYTLNGDFSKKIGSHNFMTGGDINYNDLGFLRTNYPNVITGQGLYGADRDEFRFFNPEGSYF